MLKAYLLNQVVHELDWELAHGGSNARAALRAVIDLTEPAPAAAASAAKLPAATN